MQTVIVTGSSGLIGSETAKHFAQDGLRVVGIDNDMRAQFFGPEASTKTTRDELVKKLREYEQGIPETMSIDATKHSLFGASKVAADVLVQEYGRYFGMPTACFRGGCLTGPAHAGAELHGFLAYLMKCCVIGRPYRVLGYKGKQVRDNIHSFDLVETFAAFIDKPRVAEVYNMGGGRFCNCSMLEAISLCEEISGRKLIWHYEETNRIGDHIWWISDVRKFQSHYPQWQFRFGLREILEQIFHAVKSD